MIKVLFAGMRWDYKDPRRGDSYEYSNFWDTLRRMPGVEAEAFYFDVIESAAGREEMNRRLLVKVKDWTPDLVFFFFFLDEFEPAVVKEVSDRVTTVNWFADDQWRFDGYSRHWAPYLTWVATTDRRAARRYRRLGYANVIQTQWGCNHHLYRPLDLARDIDVSFVGQPHGNRSKVIRRLLSDGLDVRCWGYGWDTGRISQQEMIRVFSRTKVNLNLSNASLDLNPKRIAGLFLKKEGSSIYLNRGNLVKDVLEFRGKLRDQIKGRNFEIPGCRTLLLTNRVSGLDDYFEFGKEIAVFGSRTELKEQIRYYLSAEDEREAIARGGYERTLRDHTYERRFREMFKTMGFQ